MANSSAQDIANFEDLADECFDGDFEACDTLFLQTPVDSDFEAYGSTCGGRLEAGVRGQCSELLGEDIAEDDGTSPGDAATTTTADVN